MLERAIGVIYRLQTERQSHYFHARVSGQFDALMHIDRTTALVPLEPSPHWYREEVPETFPPLSDRKRMAMARPLSQAQTMRVPVDGTILNADLAIPVEARGMVVFAHGSGSGSSRHSPRNQFVARVLQQADFGTLLMDLLTEKEEALDLQSREMRFDIRLLATRLTATVDWVASQPSFKHLPIGAFGASTGAAAALVAAAERPDLVKSVVSRGGRPDLAGDALARVQAPTLLIVGGYDDAVLALNEQAKSRLPGDAALKIVPRATHLFEEPGALAQMADLAASWFWNTLNARPKN